MNRLATLIARYQIEGFELTRDFLIRLKSDKIDISFSGFLKESSALGQISMNFITTQFFTSVLRESLKAKIRQGF